jgi:hypothetical protein
MTLNFFRRLSTLSATVLLVAASVTSSDARPHAKPLSPPQSEPFYDKANSDSRRDWDSSCFRSTGLPAMYACSGNGG